MMHAQLRLVFSAAAGGTQLHCLQQDPPWKVVRAFPNPAGESLVHLNNVSGGVFGGDRLSLQIKLGPGAAAQITTTGSTRIYRPRENAADALQVSEIHLGQGALLEYLRIPSSRSGMRDSNNAPRYISSPARLYSGGRSLRPEEWPAVNRLPMHRSASTPAFAARACRSIWTG